MNNDDYFQMAANGFISVSDTTVKLDDMIVYYYFTTTKHAFQGVNQSKIYFIATYRQPL